MPGEGGTSLERLKVGLEAAREDQKGQGAGPCTLELCVKRFRCQGRAGPAILHAGLLVVM